MAIEEVKRSEIDHNLLFGEAKTPGELARQLVARGIVRYEVRSPQSLSAAARSLSVSLRTLRRWLERDPTLKEVGLEIMR